MNCLGQCLPVDCTQGAAFIIIVGLMIHHQDSALMVIGHLLGAKETGRENQLFLSTYSVPGMGRASGRHRAGREAFSTLGELTTQQQMGRGLY